MGRARCHRIEHDAEHGEVKAVVSGPHRPPVEQTDSGRSNNDVAAVEITMNQPGWNPEARLVLAGIGVDLLQERGDALHPHR